MNDFGSLDIMRYPSDKLNIITYNDYFTRLSLIANTLFKWDNLPNDIPERFIEHTLFSHGICAFVHDDDLGFMVTKCTTNGQLNIYDEPVAYNCYGVNYNKSFNADDCVIIRNNAFNVPTVHTVALFASRLAEVERTIDVNIKGQKTPIMILCDEKQRISFQNLMKKYDGNTPFIFGTKGFDMEAVKAIKTDIPFLADQLMIYKHDLWNDAMSFLGIANANTDKRERLISDEVNANNHLIALSAEVMLKTRQQACDAINEKYGLNITVSMRSEEDVFTALAPAIESNVDSQFSNSYIYTGKSSEGVAHG